MTMRSTSGSKKDISTSSCMIVLKQEVFQLVPWVWNEVRTRSEQMTFGGAHDLEQHPNQIEQ